MKTFVTFLIALGIIYLILAAWQKVQDGVALVQALRDAITEIPSRIFKALGNVLHFLNPFTWAMLAYEFGRAVMSMFTDGRSLWGAWFDFKTEVLASRAGAQGGSSGDFSADL
jgi:hypothetical protein